MLERSSTKFAPPNRGRPVQAGGGSNCPALQSTRTPSVLRVRADCGGRLLAAKLSVVLHNLVHQLFDHLLANDAILLAGQFCDCLRDRINDFIGFIGIDFV